MCQSTRRVLFLENTSLTVSDRSCFAVYCLDGDDELVVDFENVGLLSGVARKQVCSLISTRGQRPATAQIQIAKSIPRGFIRNGIPESTAGISLLFPAFAACRL